MRALFLALTLVLSATGQAQTVYKCTVDGKTIYQASPCTAGKSATINTPRGPSEQDVKDAQARADADRARADPAKAPAKTAEAPKPAAPVSACPGLYAQYQQAIRDRDNSVRLERRMPSGVVTGRDYMAERFDKLEAQMRASNCPIPGA